MTAKQQAGGVVENKSALALLKATRMLRTIAGALAKHKPSAWSAWPERARNAGSAVVSEPVVHCVEQHWCEQVVAGDVQWHGVLLRVKLAAKSAEDARESALSEDSRQRVERREKAFGDKHGGARSVFRALREGGAETVHILKRGDGTCSSTAGH
eukprot:5785033-Alexandrium_andersonii.AAC.1